MKINKNGFSMVELLGVITVLGIIALVCVPAVSGLLKRAGEDYYVSIEKNVKASGIDYFTDHKDLLPSEIGQTAIVYVGDETNSQNSLVGLSYIDDVIDRKEKTCGYFNGKQGNFSYVIVSRVAKNNNNDHTSNFVYTACMTCPEDNYNTNIGEYEYCNSSYLPNNNFYIKAPSNYYLQISEYDYKRTKLSQTKSNGESTYDYFELRKAGIRNNDGIQQVKNNKAVTISPNTIDLYIDGKDVADITATDKGAAFNDLVNKLSSQMKGETFENYLKNHTIKLKLNYSYKEEKATRTGYTYITLIKESAESAGLVNVNSYYVNDNTQYYSSIAQENTAKYLYSYNVNHNNSKYASLLENKILTNVENYTTAQNLPPVNRGIKVSFQSIGTSLFECSLDKTTWYPCESGQQYKPDNDKIVQDEWVRAINMFGKRGPMNRYPLHIDTRTTTLTTTINKPTGDNGWYKENVTIQGSTVNAGITKYCTTTTKTTCDPFPNGTVLTTTFESIINKDTPGTTYCYQSITASGILSEKKCYTIKRDTTPPVCATSCNGSSTTWTNNTRKITCVGTDTGSGINTEFQKENREKTFTTDTLTSTLSYTLKDNAGNTRTCSNNVNVYVDKTAPTCTVNFNGTSGNSGWYITDNVTVSTTNNDATKNGARSGIKTSWLSTSNSASSGNNTASQTSSTTGTTWYGYVKDNAGNIGTCNKTVKLEKEKPILTLNTTKTNETTSMNPGHTSDGKLVFNTSKGACGFGKCSTNNCTINGSTQCPNNQFAKSCKNVNEYYRYFNVSSTSGGNKTIDDRNGSIQRTNAIYRYDGCNSDNGKYIYNSCGSSSGNQAAFTAHTYQYTSPAGRKSNSITLYVEYNKNCGY